MVHVISTAERRWRWGPQLASPRVVHPMAYIKKCTCPPKNASHSQPTNPDFEQISTSLALTDIDNASSVFAMGSTIESTSSTSVEMTLLSTVGNCSSGTFDSNFYNPNFQGSQETDFQSPFEPSFWDIVPPSPSPNPVDASARVDLTDLDTLLTATNWALGPPCSGDEYPLSTYDVWIQPRTVTLWESQTRPTCVGILATS